MCTDPPLLIHRLYITSQRKKTLKTYYPEERERERERQHLEEGRDRHTLDQTSSITAEASCLNQTNRREAKRNQDMETTGNLKVPVIY